MIEKQETKNNYKCGMVNHPQMNTKTKILNSYNDPKLDLIGWFYDHHVL